MDVDIVLLLVCMVFFFISDFQNVKKIHSSFLSEPKYSIKYNTNDYF